MISRDQLQEMFDGMGQNAGWNIDGPLLWGYFFTAKTKAPLELAAPALEKKGYRIVDIYENDEGTWWLHVEKEEHHDVDSLSVRNQELESFADEWMLGSYDGMDAGPIK